MQWISCKVRYPKECENVLVYSKGHPITGGYLITERNGIPSGWHINDWDENDTFWNWVEVSHWMPPPEPPISLPEVSRQ